MKHTLFGDQYEDIEPKRKKIIRSCQFCRKRKLKCDKQRPICSSCNLRNFNECVYMDSNNSNKFDGDYQLLNGVSSLIDKKIQNVVSTRPLEDKIDGLRRQLQHLTEKINANSDNMEYKSGKSLVDDSDLFENNISNPLYDFTFFQVKSSGRHIMYGPTSMRTYIHKDKWGFGEKCHQLISKVKLERNKWKQKNEDASSVNELQLIETPHEYHIESLLGEVCQCLPSHTECIRVLNAFFDPSNDELYHMNRILDRNKIFNDYFNSFVQSTAQFNFNEERPIEALQPTIKKNFYKIGVIIMILCIVKYGPVVPRPIHKLLAMLTGQISSKVFYVERAQFLTLRCEYRKFHMTDGDHTHLINLIGLTTDTAMTIGLGRNTREVYRDKENVVGTLDSLEDLWYNILLLDVESSFLAGKPLGLENATIDIDAYDVTMERSTDAYFNYKNKLKKFLILSRPMLSAIHKPRGIPNLKLYCNKLLEYIRDELEPVSNFTDEEKIRHVRIRDIRLFNLCLQMILVFFSLRFAVFGERDLALRNTSIQCSLILLKVNSLFLRRCFDLDKPYHSNLLSNEITSVTPYIDLFLYITNDVVPRVSSVVCPLIYHKLTRFESGFIISPRNTHQEWDFSFIVDEHNRKISVLEAFDVYCKLISEWANPDDALLKRILEKSQYINVSLNIEKIYRTIIIKTLEFRTKTESTWADKEIELESLDGSLEPINLPFTTNASNGGTPLPGGKVLQTQDANDMNILSKPTDAENEELIQSISNEFWANYNSGWDEMMSKAYTENFLNNL